MERPLEVAGKTVLVVQAHPDDADFYCAGTVARFAGEGARIVYLICTDGSKGTLDPAMPPELLAKIRQEEQRAANHVLGVAETHFLGFPDLECPQGGALREKITRACRSLRPDILMTFDPWKTYEFHPDHTAVGREALYARLAAKMPLSFPEHLKEGLAPVEINEILLFKTDIVDYWVDVEDFIGAKREALQCHRSQFADFSSNLLDAERVLREMMPRHPVTGRKAEGFKRISLEGMLL